MEWFQESNDFKEYQNPADWSLNDFDIGATQTENKDEKKQENPADWSLNEFAVGTKQTTNKNNKKQENPAAWSLYDFGVGVKSVANNNKKRKNSAFYIQKPLKVVKLERIESPNDNQLDGNNEFIDEVKTKEKPEKEVRIKKEPENEENIVDENVTTKNNKEGICSMCSKSKEIYTRSMCKNCYRTFIADRKSTDEWKKLNYRNCANCKKHTAIEARGLCRPCYIAIKKRSKEELKKFPTKKKSNITCAGCGQRRAHCAQNLCKSCYAESKKLPQLQIRSDQITYETDDTFIILDGIESLNVTQSSIDAFLQEVYKFCDNPISENQVQVLDQQEAPLPKAKKVKEEPIDESYKLNPFEMMI